MPHETYLHVQHDDLYFKRNVAQEQRKPQNAMIQWFNLILCVCWAITRRRDNEWNRLKFGDFEVVLCPRDICDAPENCIRNNCGAQWCALCIRVQRPLRGVIIAVDNYFDATKNKNSTTNLFVPNSIQVPFAFFVFRLLNARLTKVFWTKKKKSWKKCDFIVFN